MHAYTALEAWELRSVEEEQSLPPSQREGHPHLALRSDWSLRAWNSQGLRVEGLRLQRVMKGFRVQTRILGGSWVVISGGISRVTILITHIRGLITLLTTTNEPPSIWA